MADCDNRQMHTTVGTKWLGIPTALDRLFFPSVLFAGGGTGPEVSLLIAGVQFFILSFRGVEAICGFEETPYWSLADENTRPQNVLNIIEDTQLLHQFKPFSNEQSLRHFLICGGDMCVEIIAAAYAIEEFDQRDQAAAVCAGRMTGSQNGVSFSKWVIP